MSFATQFPADWPMEFTRDRHIAYLLSLDRDKTTMSSFRAESIKMGGVYWGLTAMSLLKIDVPAEKREKLLLWIDSCFDQEGGGYGWSSGHDGHLTASHYAVLLLVQLGVSLSAERIEKISNFVKINQKSDGSFQCDEWGETDLRFAYDAVAILSLLRRDDWKDVIDTNAAVEWINACQNKQDGAFGPNPGLESHAAYTFCAVAALTILGAPIHAADVLGHWLCERQTPAGGFNGRPEKAPDVCYSWWILSALHVLKKDHWIEKSRLETFILRSQELEHGGIADRPECVPDVFHTFFGIAALALIDSARFDLRNVNVLYAIPSDSVAVLIGNRTC